VKRNLQVVEAPLMVADRSIGALIAFLPAGSPSRRSRS
jgi:hypothetical protein